MGKQKEREFSDLLKNLDIPFSEALKKARALKRQKSIKKPAPKDN